MLFRKKEPRTPALERLARHSLPGIAKRESNTFLQTTRNLTCLFESSLTERERREVKQMNNKIARRSSI